MKKPITFSEIELAGDIKAFISFNPTSCDASLKEIIFKADEDDFFKVTKQISSPLKIINIEAVTEELLNNAL